MCVCVCLCECVCVCVREREAGSEGKRDEESLRVCFVGFLICPGLYPKQASLDNKICENSTVG